MSYRMFQPGCECCGYPLVIISTCDSSVNYTYLCFFEDANGNPGNSCPPGTNQNDPDGSCVLNPKQADRDKWNLDRNNFTQTRLKHEANWPVAGGIISGGYRCWAGVKAAITAISEPWVQDTYGDFIFAASGTGNNARINLADLQNLFAALFQKHNLPDNNALFGFLFIVDNTGSITVNQWPAQVKTDFINWVQATYPNCRIREIILSNYLVDGEDWVRHCDEYYQDVVKNGI